MPGYSSDRVSKLSSSTLKALNLSNTFWADSILVSTFLMHLFSGRNEGATIPIFSKEGWSHPISWDNQWSLAKALADAAIWAGLGPGLASLAVRI